MEHIKKQDDELFEFMDTSLICDVHYIKNVYIDLKENDTSILRKLEYILRSEICCYLNENITPYIWVHITGNLCYNDRVRYNLHGKKYISNNRFLRSLKHRDLANFLQPIIDNILIINEEEYKEL